MSSAFNELRNRRLKTEMIRDYWVTRIESQIRFAAALANRIPELESVARPAISAAADVASTAIEAAAVGDLPKIAAEAEAALEPLADTAKGFTIYCVGHAHIDMNWMWGWQETVAATNDTFTTVVRLLDEYPNFVFGQSQASIYRILEEHNPAILDRIRSFVREGRVEVTASHWVECDKNMVTGESLCRHLLYTREYMRELFGLEPEDVPIDWSPDTFGHAHTVPSYLVRGGVRFVYMHRPGASGTQPRPGAFRWRGPDGSEVLVRNDMHLGYNGVVEPNVLQKTLLRVFDELGLSYNLFVYGVGDHGGGPTRRDLENLRDMGGWPVFPKVVGAKSIEYFERLSEDAAELPVLDEELNFEFTGCYTTQSLVKRVNAFGLRKMVEAEAASVVAATVADRDYPYDSLRRHWRNTLFHHFHDILPGSGVRDTRTHSHGMYQEAMAFTGVTTTEALRAIAARVDTSGAEPLVEVDLPTAQPRGMGGGIGRGSVDGGISDYGYAGDTHEPVYVAFNLTAGSRKTVVRATVWDSPARENSRYEAVFPDGTRVPCQLLETGNYWAHRYQTFAVPMAVDGYGYRSFRISAVDPSDDPMGDESSQGTVDVTVGGALDGGTSSGSPMTNGAVAAVQQLGIHHVCSYALYERGPEGLANEFLEVHIDTTHGGIRSLRHKATGVDLVVNAESILEYVIERPRGMSAWQIEHHGTAETPRVLNIRRETEGPYVSAIAVDVEVSQSRFTIRYRLEATDPRLYIEVSGIWFERGSRDTGTPTLRFALPLALEGAVPTYEIPFGGISRAMEHGEDVPALRWADVVGTTEGRTLGVLLVNDSKHGHSYHEDVLRVTLLRSSFDPDPLPEVDEHNVLLAVEPHESRLSVSAASSVATEVTEPVVLIQTDSHPGELKAADSFLQVSGGAVVSGVKMAESGDGIVVRLYNPDDDEITAEVSFGDAASREISAVREVDLLERPVDGEGITVSAGTASVPIAARAIRTVVLA